MFDFSALLRAERLDDIAALLAPRAWDEVPLVSRLHRIAALASLGANEVSRQLLIAAVGHLARVVEVAEARPQNDLLVIISLLHWDDLFAEAPEPIIPNFWIATDVARSVPQLRFVPGRSSEARLVTGWLASAGLEREHDVFDPLPPEDDRTLRRVYVARRGRLGIDRFVIPPTAALRPDIG